MDEQARIRTRESQAARLERLRFYAATIILAVLLPIAAPASAQILQSLLLQTERAGHSATLLGDGRVLIAGGANQGSALSTAERYDPATGASSAVGGMTAQRTDHAAVLLADGRVLVTGGRNAGGTLATSEIFNPAAGTFTSAPSLNVARYGHSATALADGRVLIAGGDLDGSAEIYEPGTGSFTLLAAQMWAPHAFHGAMLRADGSVFIVGGIAQSESTVLGLAESFDPTTMSFAPASALQIARARATLRALPDGKIQVAGGTDNGEVEIYDPQTRSFTVRVPVLVAPLTVSDLLRARTRSALIHPQAQGSTPADVYALVDRSEYTLTELAASNSALVAGGVNGASQPSSSALLVPSSPASVTTQRSDYHPGQHVTVSGSGFAPDETVSLQFHEEPETHPDVLWTATASASGSFTNSDFAPVKGDIGRRFTLTAIGQSSGFIAQTGFNDAGPIAFVGNIGTNSFASQTNSSITVTVGASGVGAGNSIIVTLRVGSFAGAIGCSDTKANAYNPDITSLPGAARGAIVSAHNVTALVAGDIITCIYPQFSGLSLVSANEFSGLDAAPQDQTSQLSSSNAGAATSGLTTTTTQADELVFGLFNLGAVVQTITPATSGSNPLESPYVPAYTKVGVIATMNPMYRVVAATRQYESNGTVVGSGGWRSQVVTYKASTATTGTLTVNKSLSPVGDPGLFDLQIDGFTAGTGANAGNGGTTGPVTVTSGPHTVGEAAGTATSLANYDTVIGGDCLADGTVTVGTGEAKVCTITNTRKSATLTLAKTWVNGAIGDTATVTSAGFTNNATSGASVSSGNNTTTGSSVTVFAGESATISELFSVGSAANYTAVLACTGNGTPLAGSTLTINPADTAITCTFTNTRKSATLALAKTWVNGAIGDTATVTSAGFTNNATSGASVSSGNNTTTGSSVTVFAGETGTISELFSVGSAANYTAGLACTGNGTPLAGSSLTVNAADTAIVCTFTNTRKSATLTLAKTWVNGAIGDTATVTSTGFTNSATSGASVSSGSNTTTGSAVGVAAGESGTIGESFSVGSAANYTAVLACTGNTTPLSGNTLTINAADTAIVCTFTNTRKSATLTLAKTWVNGANGDTATVTSTGFTNNATSGASVSSGNNTTTGSSVTVFVGESGTISELFSVGSAANYTAGLACTGNGTPLAGSSLTVNAADTAIVCTFTNTRKSATLTLAKTWVNGANGDTATVTSTGFTNSATSGASVSSGNNTTTGSSVTVFVGESGTISELFSVGSVANYTAGLACTGNGTPLAGSSLTINPADTAITCTFTNTRKSATLTLAKTWVNGASGDTATVTSTGFTNNATSGASVSSGNNTTTGSSVTVFAGASGTISESFSVGSAANYTAVLACTGNGTPLAGSSLTINPADTAITCTFTNTRKSATLTLVKTWVNGAIGDTATVTSAGFTNNATSGASVSSGNNTTTGSSVTVFAGASGTISESFSVGSAANYNAVLACTGNGTPLAGSTLTINPADTAIVCTFTNARGIATLTLRKTWVNGASGDTATVTSTGFTSNATSGASVSSGNNTTTGSAVGVAVGESGTISELFSVGSAANYTAVLACTGNNTPLSGSTLTINAADTAITCTFTNTRKSATLTLAKTWVNGAIGDTATVTSAGFTNNATSGASVSSGNNTTTGSSVTVFAGASGTISESFSVGSAANYAAALACTGNGTPLSGNTLTINAADTAIVCTFTNTRGSATLTLRKTWVNGANGDTATVTSTGFTSSATSGASVSSGNNTTTGSAVGVAVGESGTIGESFSVGSAANYTAALACTGNNTPLSGNTLTINAADTAIVCTFTNTRKSSTLTLAMTWVNGAIGDTATVSSTGFTNNATSGLSVSSGNNTTTGSPVTVFAGASGTISVLFSVGNAGNYTPVIACTGNGTPLAGSTLTINPADTAISCTFTDTRKSATLTLAKTWSNGISGDTATVTSTGLTNNATSGASVSSGNNTTTGSAVTAFAGESGTIGESFSVGSAASYTAVLACTGNGTPLAGGSITINPADTAVVCTITNNKQGPPAPVVAAIIPTLDPALLAGLALLLAGAGAWAARRRGMIADADKRWRD